MNFAELLESFKTSKQEIYKEFPEVDDYTSPLQKGLWVLWVANKKFKFEGYLTADEISEVLRNIGVSVSTQEIIKSFARAGGKIDRQKKQGKASYKIMNQGKKLLESGLGNISLMLIEGGKPRTDKRKFSDIVKSMKGDLLILDKYIGTGTLALLEQIAKGRNIRFLTGEVGKDDAKKFTHELNDFKKEYKNVEIKKYGRPHELHDRYIISKDGLLILGHGLKDLGSKESFVIKIDANIAQGIIDSLRENFLDRWGKSQNLK